MKIRGQTVERRKDYNAVEHVEQLRAREDRIAKIREDMPKEAHKYMKLRQRAFKHLHKQIRGDRS